jgi:endonuclease
VDGRYSEWLRRAVPTESTWRTKLSELRRVEAAYGDIDSLYDSDELQSLIDTLTYSTEDERRNAPNPSRLEIGGNIRNNLASYKSAVQKYARFRQDVELEAARPVLTGRPVAEALSGDAEQTFSLERDLQAALRRSIVQLEPGLTVVDGGAERSVPSGRIDILAQDQTGARVVIELKAVRAPRDAVAQTLAYMGMCNRNAAARFAAFWSRRSSTRGQSPPRVWCRA